MSFGVNRSPNLTVLSTRLADVTVATAILNARRKDWEERL